MAKVKVTDVVEVIIVVEVMVMAVVVVVAEEIIIVFSLKTNGPTKSGIIMKINLVMKNKKKVGSSSNACYRCGSNNHWSKTCQQSIKDKAKGIVTNFTYEVANVDVADGHKDHNDATNLDYDDFFIEPTNLDSGDIVTDTTQLDACNFPYL
ncbi:putative transcription factor interactor and regulator CCHC(Zn) family [Helianthus annuus]|nr:putative transcription factor interactor and regulator CCHC(Zn) family [Helianthus annuus]